MSYVDFDIGDAQEKMLLEGKINTVFIHNEDIGEIHIGDYLRFSNRLYRVLRLCYDSHPCCAVGLGFMGMYGDEE